MSKLHLYVLTVFLTLCTHKGAVGFPGSLSIRDVTYSYTWSQALLSLARLLRLRHPMSQKSPDSLMSLTFQLGDLNKSSIFSNWIWCPVWRFLQNGYAATAIEHVFTNHGKKKQKQVDEEDFICGVAFIPYCSTVTNYLTRLLQCRKNGIVPLCKNQICFECVGGVILARLAEQWQLEQRNIRDALDLEIQKKLL